MVPRPSARRYDASAPICKTVLNDIRKLYALPRFRIRATNFWMKLNISNDFINNAEPQQNTYVNLVVECFAGAATLCGWGSGGLSNNPQDFFVYFLSHKKVY